jgi:hypothetical protein
MSTLTSVIDGLIARKSPVSLELKVKDTTAVYEGRFVGFANKEGHNADKYIVLFADHEYGEVTFVLGDILTFEVLLENGRHSQSYTMTDGSIVTLGETDYPMITLQTCACHNGQHGQCDNHENCRCFCHHRQ